jgi:hypothetical protein
VCLKIRGNLRQGCKDQLIRRTFFGDDTSIFEQGFVLSVFSLPDRDT